MEMNDEVHARVSRELKRALEDKRVPVSQIIRDALQKAVGMSDDIQSLMLEEEGRFGEWADSFVRLYQFVNKKLQDRDNLIISESVRLEEAWKRIQERMKSREELMEAIPELKALRFEDAFDWNKIMSIIELYPQTLRSKIGFVQVREALFLREVREGRFESVQAARDKLQAEIALRAALVQKELTEWTEAEEYKKQYMLKQEELRLEAERKRGREFKETAKGVYDHAATCEDTGGTA